MAALMKERMCKFIFSVLLVLLSFTGKGQTVDGKLYTIFNNWYQWSGGKFNTNLNIPKVTAINGRDTGGIRYNLADSSMYIWTGSQWRIVGRDIDTTSLSNRINLKVNISDTAAMLSPYVRSVNVTTPTLQQVTTAGNTTTDNINAFSYQLNNNAFLRSFYGVDENANGFFQAVYIGLDTSALSMSDGKSALIRADNLSGLTKNLYLPNTSGNLSVGVAVNGTTYMAGTNGISDLGTISTDTTSLSSRINERVKYTDTAAMLSPYLRSNVAAATYQPIGNYDTATVVKAYVTNAEAVTITKGQVVYIFGASGDRASVKLAKNTSDTFSSKTLGIVRADIAAGQAGWITTQGQVSGINLGAFSPGDILWLDSIPGGFTATKPQAPYHSVFVGVVERANVGNGLIYVKPQNGVELDELHDVRITSVANNEIIRYNSSLGYWENKSIITTLGYTPLNVTDTTAMLSPYLRSNVAAATYQLQLDTVPLAVFGAGSGAAGDTLAFSTSAVYGSFYNAGSDTLIITQMRAGVLGTSPSITTEVYWNDSLNITAGATILVSGGTSVTGTIGATNVTSFTNNKIPPNVWVFVRTSAVATKPTYFTLTLLGYKKRI
jgi:hypothetical protein